MAIDQRPPTAEDGPEEPTNRPTPMHLFRNWLKRPYAKRIVWITLVITAGAKQGESITLTTKPVSIGRSSDSSIVIRDDYTSTHHARLEYRSGKWVLNDLGSTNGTFLAGTKVTEPTEVPLNTPITIGATTFEIRA